jgi:quinol monooxygenase YgiN
MYGTVARMRVKPGELEALKKTMAAWDEGSPNVPGYRSTTVYQTDNDSNELIMAVAFEDKKTYMANADDPKTDEWFQKMRAHLDADPDWSDGEIVYTN